MAKKASSKSTGTEKKKAKPPKEKRAGAKGKSKSQTKRPSGAQSHATSDAVRKLLESPLVADLLAVGATAALATIAQHGLGKGEEKGAAKAVKAAGAAAAAAMGRRLTDEIGEIKKAAERAKTGAKS